MGIRGGYSKSLILASALIILSFSALSATFYAGVISETDVSRSVISDRWMGISGTVERGNDSLTGYDVGTLNLKENQTGNVLSAELKGIKGGGYYMAFAPGNVTEINPEQLFNLTNETLLEEDGIFSEDIFPGFYPDYSQKFDKPSRTFETGKEIVLDGETYNASYANLSGTGDMYLLKYSTGNGKVPIFVSPVDGMNRQDSGFEGCYVSGCNFQALLPKLEGSEFSYSVNLFSRGEAVTGCGGVAANTTSMVIGDLGSQNCLELTNPGVYVDFYNTEHVGDGSECGVRVESTNVTLFDARMNDYSKAICVRNNADVSIEKGALISNSVGISAQNSNLSIENITLNSSETTDVALQGSTAEMLSVSLSGTPVYGEAESVSLQGYTRSLPRPSGISDDIEPIGSRVEVLSLSSGSSFTNLGLGYPDINETKLAPIDIYKYDEAGGSYQIKELDVQTDATEQYAYYPDTITNFSIFTLYGEDITGEESSGGQSPSEEDSGSDDAGGGTSGGGGGAAGAGGGPSFQPDPQAVELNLSLARDLFSVKKGDTISVEFTANNTGPVAAENVTVGLASDWSSVPKTFEVIRPNESRSGTVLTTIPEDAPEGNITQMIEAQFSGSTLDTEQFTVNVSEIIDTERIDVVESPPFLSLETSTRRTVGVQLENPTNRPISDIEVEFRGGSSCAATGNQTYTVRANSAESVQVELRTADQEEVCNDALVFTKEDNILGFAPMRIELNKPSSDIVSISLYLVLLLAWTAALVWRLKTRNNKNRNRFI